ncbi:MAG: hypothetical protein HY912_09680 [Desulfomonile tiedjei]|uniref:Uncharacterized protein n=1 Tax=Desulfomonile tiedjei TaxID=2358 RepID=A0A9D6V1F6_9BACT|nr:hypothetical protein [Desulfomonile tiedjei]
MWNNLCFGLVAIPKNDEVFVQLGGMAVMAQDEPLRQMTVNALMMTPRTALFATAALWVFALALSVAGLHLSVGRVLPVQDVLRTLSGLPLSPTVLAFPVFRACGWLFDRFAVDGPVVPIAAGFLWVGVLAGYWGSLSWLSWRAGVGRSRRAFVVLAVLLTASSPFWLLAVAWMAAF